MKKICFRGVSFILAFILTFTSGSVTAIAGNNAAGQLSQKDLVNLNSSDSLMDYNGLMDQLSEIESSTDSDSQDLKSHDTDSSQEENSNFESNESASSEDTSNEVSDDNASAGSGEAGNEDDIADGSSSSDSDNSDLGDDTNSSDSSDNSDTTSSGDASAEDYSGDDSSNNASSGASDISNDAASLYSSLDESNANASNSASSADLKVNSGKEIHKTGKWSYYLDDEGYAHITGYADTDIASLSVPKKLNKYFVVAIEDNAFSDLNNLSSVSIPFYIKTIGSDVFNSDVTIKAYFGAYALKYAKDNNFKYENLSELDFAEGALDLTEIYRASYSMLSELEIEMNRLEASYLSEGCVFYLPPSEELPNGDAFKVVSKQDNGNTVIIYCERALGAEVLDRLVINESDLLPDWENAVFYNDSDNDGYYEEYTTDDMELNDDGSLYLNGLGSFSFSASKESSFSVSGTIFEKEIGSNQKLSIDWEAESTISFTSSVNVDINFAKAKIDKFELSNSLKYELSGSINGKAKKEIPLVKCPVQTTGLETIYFVIKMVLEVDGSISISYSASAEFGVRYVNNGLKPFFSYDLCDTSVEVSVTAKFGISAGLEFSAIGKIVTAGATVGKGIIYEIANSYEGDGAEATISKYYSMNSSVTIKFLKLEWTRSITPLNVVKAYKTISVKKYTVMFSTGKILYPVNDQSVAEGGKLTEPEAIFDNKGNGIQGWYKDKNYTEKWDFAKDKVYESMILYAKWANAYTVTYDYGLDGIKNDKKVVVEGSLVPEIDGAKKQDYKFINWCKDNEYTTIWDFDKDIMPSNDLTLYANYEYIQGYNPWDVETIEGEHVVEDDIEYSTDGFEFTIEESEGEKYAVVTGYTGEGGAVCIPTKTGSGIKVKSISSSALRNNKTITNVKIPNSVSYASGVLAECTNVESVSIPDVI
ncbi:MAG: InlB B-repeat-containing protein, partial [Butyrivibrio sp.]|nr:InlB B-repeat-containing protein [Butyrivibrio sp.]